MSNVKHRNTREFIRLLLDNGFVYVGCKGDHRKFRRNGDTVIVNNRMNRMVIQRLIKENCLVEER